MSWEDRTPPKPEPWKAKGEAVALVVVGVVIAAVGGIIAYVAWPGVVPPSMVSDGGTIPTGSGAWVLIGGIVALIGQTIATIGVIAVGVRLGTRD